MWAAYLHVALQKSLDILIGGVLSQTGREVFQLVQQTIQVLSKLSVTQKLITYTSLMENFL